MKTLSNTLKSLTCALFILALSSVAHAQATRTWVSGVGDDVNPCSRTAPCKTFAGAISKTATAGEINAIDPGGFGAVTITKSMTIDGGGTFASILASGTTGVIVNVNNAADTVKKVTLRRLSINGTGTTLGTRGINAILFNQLHVENCYIQNFSTVGIDLAITNAVVARVSVKDTNIANTGVGIQGNNTNAGGVITALMDNVKIDGGTTGINAKDRAFFVIKNSTVHGASTAGVAVNAPSNSAFVSLEHSFLFSDGVGVAAGGAGTTVDFSNTSITQNTTAVSTGGATLRSHGNNQIFDNQNAGTAPTIVGPQ